MIDFRIKLASRLRKVIFLKRTHDFLRVSSVQDVKDCREKGAKGCLHVAVQWYFSLWCRLVSLYLYHIMCIFIVDEYVWCAIVRGRCPLWTINKNALLFIAYFYVTLFVPFLLKLRLLSVVTLNVCITACHQ